MIPYYILIIIPLLICAFENRGIALRGNNGNIRKVMGLSIFVFFSIFIVLLSFRGLKCGIDQKNYTYYFQRYSTMSWDQVLNTDGQYDVEIGFRLFTKLVSYVSIEFQIYIAIISLLSVIPILFLYKSEASSYALPIVLFLSIGPFSLYFSGLRQVLAMSFVYPAFRFTKNKKLIPFLLCVFFASLFHTSAFILILLYPIYRANITKKWLYFVIPSMLIIFIFNKSIFGVLLSFLADTRYESYSMSETGAYGMLLLFVALSAIILLFTTDEATRLSREDIGLRNLLLLCTILQFFAPLSHVAMRMNYYYIIFLPIAIPKLIDKAGMRYKQIAKLLQYSLLVFFLVRFIQGMYTSADILQVFPYVPFWK